MRIVLDSNVLVASLGMRSRLRPIWQAFIDGRYQLVVSEDILKEYEEILNEHSAPGTAAIVMEIFIESPDVIAQKVYYNWNAILTDPDDNKFFDIAVAADADYLVTNDKHFDAVKNIAFPKVNVITADDFLNLLGRS
ncbi:putative toxin-antitoxin system toxin component, PIN family [uncultured Mucilaginibacter sp.]|uniref:putative toxin-antitoxin system toxin component, PIN family n=1 Tax=uncultured Mucilaginibacter sp. TaxID=797541 RepID=UPI0025DDAA0F|nr:putative toxin-antitoxin system toxin component, PIN family [uncultured Mucilaginibacter sp.]